MTTRHPVCVYVCIMCVCVRVWVDGWVGGAICTCASCGHCHFASQPASRKGASYAIVRACWPCARPGPPAVHWRAAQRHRFGEYLAALAKWPDRFGVVVLRACTLCWLWPSPVPTCTLFKGRVPGCVVQPLCLPRGRLNMASRLWMSGPGPSCCMRAVKKPAHTVHACLHAATCKNANTATSSTAPWRTRQLCRSAQQARAPDRVLHTVHAQAAGGR